jgi:DNA-binding NarL/FixJ family response regulator
MIIDDHEISRAACRALLRTEGVNVVADFGASDGVLAAVGALRPDVAIVDVTPATDTGFAVARGLRALAAPPIVILTSSADRARFGEQVNGYRFIAKADIRATAIAALATAEVPASGFPANGDVTTVRPSSAHWRSDW